MDYGRAIRMARASRQLLQKDVAERAGITNSYLSLIEQGHRTPSMEKLASIASAIGVPMPILTMLAAEDADLKGIDAAAGQKLGGLLLEMISAPTGVPDRLVSMRALSAALGTPAASLHDITKNVESCYRPFDVRPLGKAKWRHIDNPTGRLRAVQARIYKNLLADFSFPSTMCGGIAGRTTKDCAAVHSGQRKVVTLDIKACFPSTTNQQVHAAWKRHFGCGRDTASVLTKLTTFHRKLPQGAPTSTALANLVLLPLHEEIVGVCQDLDVEVSQFIDDIALSGPRATEAIGPIVEILEQGGYGVSAGKLRIMRADEGIEVVGLAVDEGVSVPDARIARFRDEVQEIADRGVIFEHERQRIDGFVGWVTWVSADQGATLSAFVEDRVPAHVATGRRPRSRKVETRACKRGRQCLARKRRRVTT